MHNLLNPLIHGYPSHRLPHVPDDEFCLWYGGLPWFAQQSVFNNILKLWPNTPSFTDESVGYITPELMLAVVQALWTTCSAVDEDRQLTTPGTMLYNLTISQLGETLCTTQTK